ncbi:hypothetical protein TAMA11512_22290 [Selenomonas sp. TAMA-11512]|uniref:hypothetical protein n=1 Tax=Selenomonas sp. TAMA-11512 TaxID=3095337 RepID=UPI00308DC7A4|nr:hypothetical protein TAMA11512_22290 [Selenomonas sp. TAMA-11512]
MTVEEALSLLETYGMLAGEMEKFLADEKIDTFFELQAQRAKLYAQLGKDGIALLKQDTRGQAMLREMEPREKALIFKAKTWLNRSRNNTDRVHSYDVHGFSPLGHIFNREY